MEFYFRRPFFVSTFAPSTGNNNLIDGAFEDCLEKRLRLSKAQASLVLHSACALFENLVQRYLGNENRFPTLIKTFIRFSLFCVCEIVRHNYDCWGGQRTAKTCPVAMTRQFFF